jgi:hypothetical protein
MARELGPKGLYVTHLVVDGAIDSPATQARRRAITGGQNVEVAPDSLMNLASIAETYWALSQQSGDAWTFELDIRPFVEPF